jgi:hypothetical protein
MRVVRRGSGAAPMITMPSNVSASVPANSGIGRNAIIAIARRSFFILLPPEKIKAGKGNYPYPARLIDPHLLHEVKVWNPFLFTLIFYF